MDVYKHRTFQLDVEVTTPVSGRHVSVTRMGDNFGALVIYIYRDVSVISTVFGLYVSMDV